MWGVNYLVMLLDKFHLVDYTNAYSVLAAKGKFTRRTRLAAVEMEKEGKEDRWERKQREKV